MSTVTIDAISDHWHDHAVTARARSRSRPAVSVTSHCDGHSGWPRHHSYAHGHGVRVPDPAIRAQSLGHRVAGVAVIRMR